MLDPSIENTQAQSISRTFWRYTLPAIAAMLVNGLYQIVDGIFIGHYIGFEGLAAINMAWPVIYFMVGFGIMVGMGSGSLLSIQRGKGDTRAAATILTSSLVIMLALAGVSTAILSVFSDFFLIAQGGAGNTLVMAQDYIGVFTWGTAITVIASAIPLLIRNDESPNIATGLMVLGACINILLDYLLIGVFNFGLLGASIATISAQAVVCLLGLFYFCSRLSSINWSAKFSWFNAAFGKQIVLLGSSSLFMYLYTSFVFALHNRLFTEYGTPLTVGAFAIVGYLMVLYYLVAEGVAEGMQPPVSYYYGAEQHKNINKMLKLSVKVTLIAGTCWVLLLNLLPETMVGLFNNDDPLLIATAIDGIKMHLFAMPLDGFIALSSVYFMATNQGVKALVIACGNMLIQLPFLYFLPKVMGVEGVWMAMPLSNIALCLIVVPMVWLDVQSRKKQSTEQQDKQLTSDAAITTALVS
ncbi:MULTISPECIES: MATE family efflux transporter [unclassified Shewanella]|uniref:MATE family efflux transporter n=1 Tax=unclassified Shewanella TaxID=196818 RepID=UPI001BC80BDC|nr:MULTISPECIES: MATE family efflux transporter [unclassified Shewanella]GIU20296.1 MATE family efflux transporter [Shewanella sp. MBTL60-112-B1]GIU39378.1 MATE family efflux transporter [Shewanella sp. MBTL60-112-B2]